MKKIYGYCRVSTKNQNIERQVRNIKGVYPHAVIVQEAITGRSFNRTAWRKLEPKLMAGDTVVFDSVSRMSRNAEEGYAMYAKLYQAGVNLVYLKEPHINTDTFKNAYKTLDTVGNAIADIYIEATNKVLMVLAQEQIRLAFIQSQKEVDDMSQRIKEGLVTARLNGKTPGNDKGDILKVKKKEPTKALIRKYSNDFSGTLTDGETIAIIGIARNTYYKYKREMKEETE